MTQVQLLLIPVFIQVALTFAVLVQVGRKRVAAVGRGEVRVKDIALGQKVWPDHITQLANSYTSQFELPVLFYAVVMLALVTGKEDVALVAGAWVFALSRIAHAWVHVTSNHVPTRFRAFLVGVAVLAAMWCWLAMRVLGEGA